MANTKSRSFLKRRWPDREVIAPQSPPLPTGIIYTNMPDLARVYHACVAIRATPPGSSAYREPSIEPSDHASSKNIIAFRPFFS